MGVCKSTPFFAKSVILQIFFFKLETTISSRKVNVNAIVTSNFSQIVRKATCLMAMTQNNSNDSLTPELNDLCSKKEMIMMMMMMSRIERTDIRVLFTFLFAVGSDVSILKAPLAAAISPFMSPLNPPNP